MKEDYRITKTKRALAKALFELLSERKIDDITVNDLCLRANIRRTTFYKHYRDKMDFLAYIVATLRSKFDRRMKLSDGTPDREYFALYAKHVILFMARNINIMNNLYTSTAFPTVLTTMSEQNYRDTYDRLIKYRDAGGTLKTSPEILASSLVGIVTGSVQFWMSSNIRKPLAELSDEVELLVLKLLD